MGGSLPESLFYVARHPFVSLEEFQNPPLPWRRGPWGPGSRGAAKALSGVLLSGTSPPAIRRARVKKQWPSICSYPTFSLCCSNNLKCSGFSFPFASNTEKHAHFLEPQVQGSAPSTAVSVFNRHQTYADVLQVPRCPNLCDLYFLGHVSLDTLRCAGFSELSSEHC